MKPHHSSKSPDEFALIATSAPADRTSTLEEPQPPLLPVRPLPVDPSRDGELFASPPPCPANLSADLDALREKFAPFLRRVAPPLPAERKAFSIETFLWRIGDSKDERNLPAVLAGEGAWETVTIPHYGAPLGRAVTYYRRELSLPADFASPGAVFLCFQGVDYKAQVFLNGNYVGSHEGFFAPFEFDVTSNLRAGTNTLLVKVENDAVQMGNHSWTGTSEQGDKIYAATGPGYDDPQIGWHHCPPGMGICQTVRFEARALQHFHDLFIRPRREEGLLDLTFEVWNCATTNDPVDISFSIFGRNFEAVVCIDRKLEGINPAGPRANFYKLTVRAPGLRDWEPDSPWLYELHAELRDAKGNLIDAASRHFGMRSFRVDEGSVPKGRIYLNGREIRLRGANTMGFEQ